MTPETLIIDRRFAGVGRVKLRTGTTSAAVRRRLNRMLDTLADEGRVDVLRAIRDRRVTLMEVHYAFQRKALDQLPSEATTQLLATAMTTWIATVKQSVKHRSSLETSRRYLEREAPKAMVADIADVLDDLRTTLGREHPRSFNLLRSAASAFIRQTLKRSHPLYRAVTAVELVEVTATRKRRPLTVLQMRSYFPSPETDAVDGIAWAMCLSGMGPGEYWHLWNVSGDRIHIEGTKRAGRVRDVPLVFAPIVPTMHRRTFEDKLRERTGRALTPYDLRRTYAHLMEEAGIPRTRRKLYMGHGAGDTTDLYERIEVAEFLAADGAKLRSFVGVVKAAGLRLEAANS